jgi:hypothetical protein
MVLGREARLSILLTASSGHKEFSTMASNTSRFLVAGFAALAVGNSVE